MFKNLMLKDFIDELGSKSPTPGGGGVAALSASTASALCSMVFNLTIGKKSFNDLSKDEQDSVVKSLEKTNHYQKEFLNYMDKDAEVFLKLMQSFKLPKNTEEEKKLRKEKIQEGYKEALSVPLELANMAFDMYEYMFIACKFGNVNAISDIGVAALNIQSSIESAVLNVKINLSGINDENYKLNVYNQCNKLIQDGNRKKDEIINIVNSKI